jgi:ATP-binding cassette subfamily B protein
MKAVSDPKKNKRALSVLRYYAAAAFKYPWLLAFVFAGGLVIEGSNVGGPLVLRHLVDLLSTGTPSSTLMTPLFLTLGLFGIAMLAGWLGNRIQQLGLVYIEPKAMNDLTATAFAHLLGHSHDFFISNFSGSLTRRVTRYGKGFENVLDNLSFNFFSTTLYTIGVLSVLLTRSWVLALVVLLWTIAFIYLQVRLARWRQPLRVARAAEDSNVTGVLSDAIGNYSAISLFAASTHERGIFGDAIEKWRVATMKSWIADNKIWTIQGLLIVLMEIAIFALCLILWEHGQFTVGDFVLVQIYVVGLIDRTQRIGNNMRQLYDAFADAYEMVEILEQPQAIQDKPDADTLRITKGNIELANVGFRFIEGRDVFKDFNLSIPGGEKVALVGPSGAGKSTVTRLLLRLYDVTEGSIRIDDMDIRDITQDSLRENISFVPQEPVLFHRTLRENIAYGKIGASLEEVISASKKAHCHDFIDLLPEKYDTLVGERGVKLSGGERQRVAIARAILKNAPILILDEATSSLDSESEALIQDALRILMEGKTVVVIAHRLSTIMTMDRIVVIENGAIAAEGTHDELLNHKGSLYHKLWSIQAGGFIADE